jgi:hypothetical protein
LTIENGGKGLKKKSVKRLAGRQGVSALASRNLNKHGPFQANSHSASDLAFSDSVIGFRPFASVFGFCQRNDTRNDTRRERLPEWLEWSVRSAVENFRPELLS